MLNKKNIINVSLVLIILLVVLPSVTLAYKQAPPDEVVHQYITNESRKVWPLISYEIKEHLTKGISEDIDGSYDLGDDIITGSGEEDLVKSTWVPVYRNHYWEPDDPKISPEYYSTGLWYTESSYLKARNYWTKYVIPLYTRGEIDEAYYYLGLVAHLLEDAAQPGHVLLDCHADQQWAGNVPCIGDDAALEEFTANTGYWNANRNYYHWDGKNYSGQQYNYEDLIPAFNWFTVEPPDSISKRNIEFFRLFWYTAQKTQYFASDKKEHNFVYRDVWYNIHNWDCSGTGDNNLWKKEGLTSCVNFTNQSQIQIDDPTDSGIYVSAEAEAVMPHAMRAVAGLYRLFDDAVRIDWPTENHDYRRTSATLLKGDMNSASEVEKFAFVLKGSSNGQEQVVKPLVADIDGNGAMETVSFVHDFYYPDYTEIYAVEFKKKDKNPYSKPKKKKEWTQIAYGGSIRFPGTLANLDGDLQKELITGVWNGTVYVYDISPDGETITERWSYSLRKKWSNPIAENVVQFNGGNVVEDLDLDGSKEIILADVHDTDGDWPGEVYVLKDNGPGNQPTKFANYTFGNGGAYAPISVANIDSDDNPEIIVPSMYGMYVFDYDPSAQYKLTKKWNNNDGKILSSGAIADVDNDNKYEIVYTTSTGGCFTGKTCYNRTYVRDAETGNLELQINLSVLPRPAPALANLDADANLEIIVISQNYYSATPVNGDVRCYDAVTGSQCSGSWPFNLGSTLKTAYMTPSIADINNDGSKDIVFAENDGNRVFVLKNDGTELFNYQFEGFIDNGIAIADVDHDNVAELALKRAGSPITLFSTISSFNKQPLLNHISNITAIAGQLININATGEVGAADLNSDTSFSFSYSAPFNSSGLWQSTVNDSGNYSILVEVSDGNLTDFRYIDLMVFPEYTQVLENFTDNSTKKVFDYTGLVNKSVQIRLPKDAVVVYSKITLTGGSP